VVFSKIVSKADALCDAHGGDITEDLDDYVIARQSDDEELNRIAIEMAKCFPAKMIDARNWRARANALGGPIKGLSAVAQDEFKIPCITSEAGCPYPVRERHVQFHYKGIQNLLKYFGIIEGTPELTDAPINPDGYRAKAKKGGIWWPKVEIGQKVDTGQELGYMQDLFGNIIEVYKSPQKGYVRFLRVWYSVNVGEPLVGVSYS
jgi:hypothetical protein